MIEQLNHHYAQQTRGRHHYQNMQYSCEIRQAMRRINRVMTRHANDGKTKI